MIVFDWMNWRRRSCHFYETAPFSLNKRRKLLDGWIEGLETRWHIRPRDCQGRASTTTSAPTTLRLNLKSLILVSPKTNHYYLNNNPSPGPTPSRDAASCNIPQGLACRRKIQIFSKVCQKTQKINYIHLSAQPDFSTSVIRKWLVSQVKGARGVTHIESCPVVIWEGIVQRWGQTDKNS